MHLLRQLGILFVIGVLIAATAYIAITGASDPLTLAALLSSGLISAVIGGFELWDRVIPDPSLKSARRDTTPLPPQEAERRYLEGRLDDFKREENLFVPLAGIATTNNPHPVGAASDPKSLTTDH